MDADARPKSAGLHVAARLSHRDARLIVLGMLLPVFMGSLDATILATALPAIGRDFGHVNDLPWLITTYLIAATASTPLYGKISDIRGRRFVTLVAISTYMAGSLICALAPNMAVLILGRVLHGLGGGGLTSTGMVVLGDIAPPKERARYYAYFSVVYTTAGACGPALGGFLSDHLHWTAIFWFNIPLGLLALTFTATVLRRLPRHERPHRLDLLGAALIVVATVAFMLAVTSGGVRYPWLSAPTVGLLAFSFVTGALFVGRLLTAPEPLIPIAILKDPIARCAIAANTFGWGGIIGLNIFLPIYLQRVLGMSATAAGLSLMVLMAMLNTSAGLSSHLIVRHQRYKVVPMLGLALATIAVVVLASNASGIDLLGFELLLAVLGTGFGPLAPLSTTSLQNTVAIHQLGTAIGTMNFTRSLYATVLVAVFGALVTDISAAGGVVAATGPLAAAGFQMIFLAAAASLAAAFVAMWLLEEKPLRTAI
jgi:EmrB/QacA subfamily drug resistance transporter